MMPCKERKPTCASLYYEKIFVLQQKKNLVIMRKHRYTAIKHIITRNQLSLLQRKATCYYKKGISLLPEKQLIIMKNLVMQ